MAIPLRLKSCVTLMALLPAVATAAAWQGDQHSGALRFTATQAGAKFPGHFGEFRVRFDFDSANPAKGVLDVTIAMASADTADQDRDEVLHGPRFLLGRALPGGERTTRKDSSATARTGSRTAS